MKATPRHALSRAALLLACAVLFAACGGPGAKSSPTPVPSVGPTPDSHLKEPARADVVYSTLVQRGLELIGTNATRGRDPVAIINATYAGWPLVFSQYRSAATRQKLSGVRSGAAPGKGHAAFTLAGLNVVVEYGPKIDGRAPARASKDQLSAASKLAVELDRLIGPLVERSTQPVAPRATPAPRKPSPTP